MKLFNILTKGDSTDSFYEILFYNYLSNDTPTIYEYTGAVPYTFTANGSALLDWYITGNSGGVGDRTENLFNTFDIVGQVPSITNGQLISYSGSTTSLIPITSGDITVTKPAGLNLYLLLYAADSSYIGYIGNVPQNYMYGNTITGYESAKYCRLRIDRTTSLDIQIMLNEGSTALDYEPYGYKIPVLCGGETTNIYINSPLGASDTISMSDTNISIPTVQGSNTISVDTTVQPTKVYIKYIGG